MSRHERSRSSVRHEAASEGDARPHAERPLAYGEPEVVEVVKKPGETAGFYIREGNGYDRRDGIFVSRILAASSGRALGYLRVGDEILKVNGVAVKNMALDDVVILMLVPQRLTMLIRRAKRAPPRTARNKLKAEELDSHDSGLSSEHSSDLRAQRAQRAEEPPACRHNRCTCSHRKDRNFSDNEREIYDRECRKTQLARFSGSVRSLASVAKCCPERCPYCDQRMPNEEAETACHTLPACSESSSMTPMQSRMLHFGDGGAPLVPMGGGMSNSMTLGAGLNTNGAAALPSTQQLAYDNLLNMTQRLALGGANQNLLGSPLRRQSADGMGGPHDWGVAQQMSSSSPLRYGNAAGGSLATLNRKFVGASAQPLPGAMTGGLDGLLQLRVCGARQLGGGMGRPMTAIRDLYVVVEVDTARRCRTQIRSGTEEFEWDEQFELDLLEPSAAGGCSRVLSFLLFAWDAAQAQHALTAYAHVSLGALAAELGWLGAGGGQTSTVRLPLRLESRGTLLVELAYRPLALHYRRALGGLAGALAMQGALLFGAPLELSARRQGGDMVPRLVRSCVDELERRGLAVTGLYRQTGSTRTKERLRDLFERAAAADGSVDLSVEAVPDMHCISSLLKDFFRELPEPLVAPAVARPLLDTMYSCAAAQTPPLSATRLSLAVLDRLPVCAQATFTFMMDHLKRVLRKAESNKMNSHALACIFAPLFMLHAHADASLMLVDVKKQVDCMRWLLELWPASATMQLNAANSSLAAAYPPMTSSTSLHNLRNKL